MGRKIISNELKDNIELDEEEKMRSKLVSENIFTASQVGSFKR